MPATLLKNRDYTVIVAKNDTKTPLTPIGLEADWQVAQNSIIALAKKCEELDPDGITIYIASDPFQKYEHATSATLAQLFQTQFSTATTDLEASLKAALDSYFDRKSKGLTRENGEIITAILDREPKDRMAIVKLLVAATEQMDSQEELGVMFAQIGEDFVTRGFLQALDDCLNAAGAKFDIADTQVLVELQEEDIAEFLMAALHG
ncbi:MAG: hypothetical protein F6K19_07105 [Cyanothece sp. SIO1E1]|nr:hypothetical protein [Cyanothece sp. SIO1E1]